MTNYVIFVEDSSTGTHLLAVCSSAKAALELVMEKALAKRGRVGGILVIDPENGFPFPICWYPAKDEAPAWEELSHWVSSLRPYLADGDALAFQGQKTLGSRQIIIRPVHLNDWLR